MEATEKMRDVNNVLAKKSAANKKNEERNQGSLKMSVEISKIVPFHHLD